MNILPPMMTVWHHLVRKNLGDAVDVTIFDCSGKLDPKMFPGARVQKFLNLYASVKCDEFIKHIAKNRMIAWLCDDDMFFIGSGAVKVLEREFSDPKTASVSFRPRSWWQFTINGQTIEPSGSYCLALNREIWMKERLTLAPADGNRHTDGNRRYDTFDKANEILIEKGYRCAILPQAERDACVTGFSGISGAVMLLDYFHTPQEVLDYYRAPEDKAWSGNVLPGTLASMLAICTIQECYEHVTGTRYPLPSLPSRQDLERIRAEKTPLLREGFTAFRLIDDGSEKLRRAL